eukprot:scaffold27921_cov37-Tisochrysis_lutea.AAC.1
MASELYFGKLKREEAAARAVPEKREGSSRTEARKDRSTSTSSLSSRSLSTTGTGARDSHLIVHDFGRSRRRSLQEGVVFGAVQLTSHHLTLQSPPTD